MGWGPRSCPIHLYLLWADPHASSICEIRESDERLDPSGTDEWNGGSERQAPHLAGFVVCWIHSTIKRHLSLFHVRTIWFFFFLSLYALPLRIKECFQFSFIHSKIFPEHLLCLRDHGRCWECNEKTRPGFHPELRSRGQTDTNHKDTLTLDSREGRVGEGSRRGVHWAGESEKMSSQKGRGSEDGEEGEEALAHGTLGKGPEHRESGAARGGGGGSRPWMERVCCGHLFSSFL